MNEFCLRRVVNFPRSRLQPAAKVNVLVPCREELLVEAADRVIGFAADHQCRGRRLLDAYSFGEASSRSAIAQWGATRNAKILTHERPYGRKVARQVILIHIAAHGS